MKKSSIIFTASVAVLLSVSLSLDGTPRMIVSICALVISLITLATGLLERRKK